MWFLRAPMRPDVDPGAARAFLERLVWMDQIVIDASRTAAAHQ
jgi:hypothetical protein